MKKEQFVRAYAEKAGITIKQAKEVTNSFLDHLVESVASLGHGEKLDLTGVLQFEVSDVPARTGRNPQTGEEIQLDATRKVTVRPMKTLKSAVKGE